MRKFDVFIDEGDVCDASLETVLERLEIVDNVGVGSTETFVSDEGFEIGVICEVSMETVFIARVASTKSHVFDEGVFRDVIVETVFIAWVGPTK